MDALNVQIAAMIVAVVSLGIAIFQILLFLGLPLAEYSWGGKYKGVLPMKMRMMSLPSALLLVFFAYVFLVHTKVLSLGFIFPIPTNIFVWMITIFMGLNTLGNLNSKSKKERMVMTPLAGITLLACIVVLVFQ